MKGYDIPTTGETHDSVFGAEAIGIQGNVIPPQWLRHLVYPSGKPYMIAAFILSDIVYWYRPVVDRDEITGQVLGYRKKFKSDKLQRSYKSFSDMYGFTKGEVTDACHYLRDKGLIDLDFRTIPYGEIILNNVLYIGINHSAVKEITLKATPSPAEKLEGEPQEPIGLAPKGDTNTETTPETSTESDILTAEKIYIFDPNGKSISEQCKKDYLSHILAASKRGVSENSAPNPIDQYWEYRDAALKAAAVTINMLMNNVEKEDICALSSEPTFNLQTWQIALKETARYYNGGGKIARAIEVYHCGGSYVAWREKNYPQQQKVSNRNGNNSGRNYSKGTATSQPILRASGLGDLCSDADA